MTKVAMADGHISQKERRAIHDFLTRQIRYQGDDLRYIDSLIEQTEKINPNLRQIAVSFRKMTNHESSLMILDICYQIAISDSFISEEEQHELKALASYLEITPYEHERIRYKYSNNDSQPSSTESKDAVTSNYSVLGINSSASNEEVKSAYRQMVSQYHPDKVSHLGKELIEFANQKFLEINKAYENIKKQRSF
jgi:DnaJ like chaperone protein